MSLAACLAIVVQSLGQDVGPTPARMPRVMELVQGLLHPPTNFLWYAHTEFARSPSAGGEDDYPIPVSRVMCGNSYQGTMDGERARGLAESLCTMFGVRARPLRIRSAAVSVDLDLADESAMIGIELSGTHKGRSPTVAPEEASVGLEREEREELTSLGWRIHAVDLKHFPRLDGDEFTSTLVFVVGVVEFLSRVTPGEDVDLSGLLFAHELRLPPFGSAGAETVHSREPDRGPAWSEWDVRSDGVPLRFDVKPGELSSAQRLPSRLDPLALQPAEASGPLPASSRGAPAVLLWSVYAAYPEREHAAGIESITLRQTLEGRTRTHTVESPLVFVPPDFDLLQPFELAMQLAPGSYKAREPLRIGIRAGSW